MRIQLRGQKEIQGRMQNPMIARTNGYLIRALNQFASLTLALTHRPTQRKLRYTDIAIIKQPGRNLLAHTGENLVVLSAASRSPEKFKPQLLGLGERVRDLILEPFSCCSSSF
jgi:hypothetical protein